jgi:hypothetical protein
MDFSVHADYKGKSSFSDSATTIDSDIAYDISLKFGSWVLDVAKNPALLPKQVQYYKATINNLKVYADSGSVYSGITNSYLIFYPSYRANVNLPSTIDFSGKISTDKVSDKMIPSSVVYGSVPNTEFSGLIAGKIDSLSDNISVAKPLQNAKIFLKCNNCETSNIKFSGQVSLSNLKHTNTIDASMSVNILSNKISNLPTWYMNLYKSIKQYDSTFADRMINIEKFLPNINAKDTFNIRVVGDYTNAHDNYKFNFSQIELLSNGGVGVIASCYGDYDNKKGIEYGKISSNVVLKEYKALADYWLDYFYSTVYPINDKSIVDFEKKSKISFLKEMSEYPASNSKDLSIMFNISPWDSKYDISGKSIYTIAALYKKVQLQKAVEYAIASGDPEKTLAILMPEFASRTKDILAKFNISKIIPQDLWDKLIH